MDKLKNNKGNDLFDHVDYYLSRSRALADLYLADQGFTSEVLDAMPVDHAKRLRREAFAFASAQLARFDAMLRLGQREAEGKIEPVPKHRHVDKLAHRIHWSPK